MSRTSARQSPKSNRFSMIPSANIQRSMFNRSSDYKTSFNAGYLIPFFVDEVLPGDTFDLKTSHFCRLNTPVVPFMDNLYLETFFFFVPTRLVWDHWQAFNGERINPNDSTDYLIPTVNCTPQVQDIYDYMGIPIQGGAKSVNALPFRAYNLIYNEWFRDENLIDSVPVNTGDGPDNASNYTLLKRAKRHDYFTSALPWPQKGPAVQIDFGMQGVFPLANNLGVSSSYRPHFNYSSSTPETMVALGLGSDYGLVAGSGDLPNTGTFVNWHTGNDFPVITDAAVNVNLNANFSINDLRQAFQVQKLYEKDARGGTRYTEILRAHFNVISPDARLQRPEYLGGSSDRINIVPVAQNSATGSESPQGNLAAFGLSTNTARGFVKSFVEHGYIIGLVNVRADLTYQQGLHRMWSRSTRFDFYWPTLAHLGEQAVLNKELYYSSDNSVNNAVFGYQERYAEYRYKPSMITGKLRSNSASPADSLDVWHLAQNFSTQPNLSKDFIEENPPIDRIVAVPSEPQFVLDVWFNLRCARPMPVFGVPGLVDHF